MVSVNHEAMEHSLIFAFFSLLSGRLPAFLLLCFAFRQWSLLESVYVSIIISKTSFWCSCKLVPPYSLVINWLLWSSFFFVPSSVLRIRKRVYLLSIARRYFNAHVNLLLPVLSFLISRVLRAFFLLRFVSATYKTVGMRFVIINTMFRCPCKLATPIFSFPVSGMAQACLFSYVLQLLIHMLEKQIHAFYFLSVRRPGVHASHKQTHIKHQVTFPLTLTDETRCISSSNPQLFGF